MIKNNCKNNTCSGVCSRCGECCTNYIPITESERLVIKEYITKNNIKEQPYIEGNDVYVDKCPFYDRKEKRCQIYEIRPMVCRSFSCSYSEDKLEENRQYFDNRADYNGNSGSFITLNDMFYDDPIPTIMMATYTFGRNTQEKLIEFLKFTKNNDIVEAILNGDIVLEWGE